MMSAEQVDEFVDCKPDEKCECGGDVQLGDDAPERHQILELPKIAVLVWEYLIYSGVCQKCGKKHRGHLPAGVSSGMLGPRAMAAVAVLSGKYQLSKRSIEEIMSDLFGLDICLGTISNTAERVSEALEEPVAEAREYIQEQSVVYADETGHKVAGKKAWMWTAVTAFVSVFLIRCGRGKEVAKELLGEAFGGFLVSDRWNANNWIDTLQRQLCWAHLDRDFTKIAEREGMAGEIGNKLLK